MKSIKYHTQLFSIDLYKQSIKSAKLSVKKFMYISSADAYLAIDSISKSFSCTYISSSKCSARNHIPIV